MMWSINSCRLASSMARYLETHHYIRGRYLRETGARLVALLWKFRMVLDHLHIYIYKPEADPDFNSNKLRNRLLAVPICDLHERYVSSDLLSPHVHDF